MPTDQQDVFLNGRIVTIEGVALELMRVMDRQRHSEVDAAFDKGYAAGRDWGKEERDKLVRTLNSTIPPPPPNTGSVKGGT
jgi:hypothetical protein